MNTEVSTGAVIFGSGALGEPLFLLVLSERHNEWGFAKGHIEPDETETDAARREILEETGIKNIRFISGFKETASYNITNASGKSVRKISVYFLAEAEVFEKPVAAGKAVCDEIKKTEWVSFEKALSLLSYPAQKEILKKAFSVINGE
ncbi:MAG: NUDIX domain-containing protein [Elusimicrobia bacterium]|nr:NUDIX domain-containing protein [Elusimicrobiota bacterium]